MQCYVQTCVLYFTMQSSKISRQMRASESNIQQCIFLTLTTLLSKSDLQHDSFASGSIQDEKEKHFTCTRASHAWFCLWSLVHFPCYCFPDGRIKAAHLRRGSEGWGQEGCGAAGPGCMRAATPRQVIHSLSHPALRTSHESTHYI